MDAAMTPQVCPGPSAWPLQKSSALTKAGRPVSETDSADVLRPPAFVNQNTFVARSWSVAGNAYDRCAPELAPSLTRSTGSAEDACPADGSAASTAAMRKEATAAR